MGQVPVQGQEEKVVQVKTACMEIYPMWTGGKKVNPILLGLLLGLMVMLLFAMAILLRKLFLRYGWNKLYSKGGRYLCEKD